MAKALRELIELLLTEIAISGTGGVRLIQIWPLVEDFYNRQLVSAQSQEPHVDRALQEDVWDWLTLHPEVSVGQKKEFNGLTLSEAEAVESSSPNLRLFVSEERTWRALTGHDKDETKVPSAEFTLLSIIASCRSQGILQTDLVRRSGQDARSVPKRTDALKSKGYIDKRQVQVKSVKTSLCTLSRFASTAEPSTAFQEANPAQATDMIDFEAFCRDLFRILKRYQIIARSDLKEELGFTDSWRRRILNRSIRKLEALGCLQRVKAQSQFHDTMQSLHPCVLFIREPTQIDLKLFRSDYRTILSTSDQENDETEEQVEMQPPEHKLIQWTPDINFGNLIVNLISQSGTAGRTNADVINEGFGKVFRRPSENILNRITECWQLSQPMHLRDNAIVRDTALNGTVTHYIHYSYPNFKKLVDSGRAEWGAVAFRPRDAKSSKLVLPPPDSLPVTDQDGLAPIKSTGKSITQRDHYCIVSSKCLSSYAITKSDPIPCTNSDGKIVAVFPREIKESHVASSDFKLPASNTILGQIKNRPRRENETEKLPPILGFSQMSKAEKIEAEIRRGGKSTRDIFAAYGLDDSWTHVAVQLMERDGPGVYLTKKGKARPAGKRQGRPKESRIAVFRSPTLVKYLNSIPKTAKNQDNTFSPNLSRSSVEQDSPVVDSRDVTNSETFRPRERSSSRAPSPSPSHVAQIYQRIPVDPQLFVASPSSPTTLPSMESWARSTSIKGVKAAESPTENSMEKSSAIPAPVETVTSSGRVGSQVVSEPEASPVFVDEHDTSSVVLHKSRRLDKEGSVARMRRTIVMDIIKRAGGAFPAGPEMWHAYSTAWMKDLKYTEKPDSRTVRNVVKHLIDTGKLRQITFSGKDPKGLMVTRSIVMTPDTSPSDPLVTQLQEKLLTGYYIPETVNVDTEIIRMIRGNTGAPTGVYSRALPIERDITVQLKNKPASVIAFERKKEEALHRRLSKPIRLMGIKHKRQSQKGNGITSFSRPVSKRARQRRQDFTESEGELSDVVSEYLPSKSRKHRHSHELPDRPSSMVKRRRYKYRDSSYDRFRHHVDDVLRWELLHILSKGDEMISGIAPETIDADAGFVHHTVNEAFKAAPIFGDIEFAIEQKSRQVPHFSSRLRNRRHGLVTTPSSRSQRPRDAWNKRRTPKHPASFQTQFTQLSRADSSSTTRHDLGEVVSGMGGNMIVDELDLDEDIQIATSRRRRGALRYLPHSIAERVKYAIIVVRTIAGGTHSRTVDWDLVAKAFPDQDPEFIRVGAKQLLNRDRRQLAQMQEELRVKLLVEYRKPNPSIPPIDFNDMASFDWASVVTWAAAQYYSPSAHDIPLLPVTRTRLIHDLAHRVDRTPDEFEMIYTSNPGFSVAKRETIMASRPFINKLRIEMDNHGDKFEEKEAAKCWILSNIAAEEETYDASDARLKLSRLSNEMIEEAVKDLLKDRFIAQANRGRPIPGRNFVFAENLQFVFGRRRAIDSVVLREASKFKRVLDDDFKRDGVSQLKYDALDGEVLAIMALAAQGRVHILPNDPPSNPFGLTDGNYETRTLDKSIFKFQVDIVPDSNRYQYGNPLAIQPSGRPPPIEEEDRAQYFEDLHAAKPLPKLPLWLDINGNVHEDLWEAIVSAVVGVLAIRPKIDIANLHEQFQRYLRLWDIERVLIWLEKVGIAEHEEDGASGTRVWWLKEYWWMIWG